MPELPEVTTVANSLRPVLLNNRLRGLNLDTNVIRGSLPDTWPLTGTVDRVTNHAKYIDIRLDQHKHVVIHLAMAGRLLWLNRADPDLGHTRASFDFGNNRLVFVDHRHFGFIRILDSDHELNELVLSRLGPIANTMTGEEFQKAVFKRLKSKRAIKDVLLDQTFIAGIGNIYASEILFFSGINPLRLFNTLTEDEFLTIYRTTRVILATAIEMGGCSIRDYVDGFGNQGRYQTRLRVYDKDGTKCFRNDCDGIITAVQIKDRSTYYCPKCQK